MARPPNILWIVTTQWRAQACGYAGDPNARTPHLDRLAAESVNYAQAVTPHPFGPFARAAMLTGVPSPQNGVRDYFDPLPTEAATIAHELAARGYATAFFGKWHLAPRDPLAPLVGDVHARMVVPVERRGGFTLWEGFESGFLLNDPWLHGTRLPEPTQFGGYQSDVICRRAAEWIGDSSLKGQAGASSGTGGRESWFAVVSLESPHPPYAAPAGAVMPRDPREIVLPANVPRGGEVEDRARRELAGYYAHIEATDQAIGRLLLPAVQAETTIVVFTSVHGDMHGAHGLFRKGWPYEESIRVPLLVRGAPGSMARGASAAPVSLIDLRAWTVGWAEGKRVDSIATDVQHISMPSVVHLPQQCDRGWSGVRTPARKLVLDEARRPWLYFDLECDPGEMVNRADDPVYQSQIAALSPRVP